MTVFLALLVLATFLCSLVAGVLFAFAVVVMPGIRALDDRGFIRAFQAIDGVIQRNHPLFMAVWVGSALSLLAAAVVGVWAVGGVDRGLVIAAALVYLAGVQAPTVVVNVPLNDRLQAVDTATVDETAQRRARAVFEARWNSSNAVRTACASLTILLLLVLLARA